jgi:uncharacterized membrane protein YhaH (DUF805 family)
MTFTESIKTVFSKYADFNGCASKSEYWWWVLFVFVAMFPLVAIHPMLARVFWIAIMLPFIAVTTRRLHDTDRSGRLQLVAVIPFIGWIVLSIWCMQSSKRPNRFC